MASGRGGDGGGDRDRKEAVIAVGLPGAALRALLLRAVVLWILVRLLVVAVGALMEGGGPSLNSPLGVILICCALGLVDIRRRHERVLWANLGISLVAAGTVFASIATIGETALLFALAAVR
jgi:hypothetical protein